MSESWLAEMLTGYLFMVSLGKGALKKALIRVAKVSSKINWPLVFKRESVFFPTGVRGAQDPVSTRIFCWSVDFLKAHC